MTDFYRIVYEYTLVFETSAITLTDDFGIFIENGEFFFKDDLKKSIYNSVLKQNKKKGVLIYNDEVRIVDIQLLSKTQYEWYFYNKH